MWNKLLKNPADKGNTGRAEAGKWVNISNHIRGGKEMLAVEWHRETLIFLGLTLLFDRTISTPRMRRGKNREARVAHEHILVLEKP